MNVPVTVDVLQEIDGNLDMPEIRVWCHPHRVNRKGGDYYWVFPSFRSAMGYIKRTKSAERHPAIAFRGYEFDLFAVKEHKEEKKAK